MGDTSTSSGQDESTITPSQADLANTTHKLLKKMEKLSHSAMDPDLWASSVTNEKIVTSDSRIVRIVRVDIPPGRTAFVFAEYTELVTSKCIRELFGDPNFSISQSDPKNRRVVTLEELVDHRLGGDVLSCILWSLAFGRAYSFDKSKLVVQYSEMVTVKTSIQKLHDLLHNQFRDIIYADLGEFSPASPITPLPIVPSIEGLHATVQSLCRRILDAEDSIFTFSDAYGGNQKSSKALHAAFHEEKDDGLKQMEDLKIKFGHLHEEVIRHAISVAYGYEWGKSVTISDFAEAVSFVANGLNKTSTAREKGAKHLIKASPYMRMVTWAQVALKAKNAKKSKFILTVQSIVDSFGNAQQNFAAQKAPPSEFIRAWLENNSSHCLILLWFLIHADAYVPQIEQSFLKWPIPTNILEFDHQGCFKEISRNHYFYEGGESKWNYTNYEEAKEQLLRRFCLIDAIAVYAFRCQVYFKGTVFVPSIPNGATTEERVQLPWKKTPAQAESDESKDRLVSNDVEGLAPDINSCVIRVALAPNCGFPG